MVVLCIYLGLYAARHDVRELHAVQVAVTVIVGGQAAGEVLVVLKRGEELVALDAASVPLHVLPGIGAVVDVPAHRGILAPLIVALGLNIAVHIAVGIGNHLGRGGQPGLLQVHAGLAPYQRRCGVAGAGVGHLFAHLLAIFAAGDGVAHNAVAQHVLVPVAHPAHRKGAAAIAYQAEQAATGARHAVAVVDAVAVRAEVGAAHRVPVLIAGRGGQHTGADGGGGTGHNALGIGHGSAGRNGGAVAHDLLVARHPHVLVQEGPRVGVGPVATAVRAGVVDVPVAGIVGIVVLLYAGDVHQRAVEHLPQVGLLGLVAAESRLVHEVVHVHGSILVDHANGAVPLLDKAHTEVVVVEGVGAGRRVQRVHAAVPAGAVGIVVGVIVLAHAGEVGRLEAGIAPRVQQIAHPGNAPPHVHLRKAVDGCLHREPQLDDVAHFHAGGAGLYLIDRTTCLVDIRHNRACRIGHRAIGHPLNLEGDEMGAITRIAWIHIAEIAIRGAGVLAIHHVTAHVLLPSLVDSGHLQLHAAGTTRQHILIIAVGPLDTAGQKRCHIFGVNLFARHASIHRCLLQIIHRDAFVDHRIVQLAL